MDKKRDNFNHRKKIAESIQDLTKFKGILLIRAVNHYMPIIMFLILSIDTDPETVMDSMGRLVMHQALSLRNPKRKNSSFLSKIVSFINFMRPVLKLAENDNRVGA
jgi:hypothetical protein